MVLCMKIMIADTFHPDLPQALSRYGEVFDGENRIPEDDPILKAPNVIMTPHLGANSRENITRVGAEIVHIADEFCKSGEKCARNMSY